jgi:uncharacterized protein YukE
MSDQYEVLTEALAAHAKNVDGFADRLAQAADAAREVSLPSDAYGVCCQALPAMLNPLQHIGTAAVDSSVQRLRTTSTDTREAAENCAEIDDRNALDLRRMRGLV